MTDTVYDMLAGYVSDCCKAKLTIQAPGGADTLKGVFHCTKCGEQCDFEPTAKEGE